MQLSVHTITGCQLLAVCPASSTNVLAYAQLALNVCASFCLLSLSALACGVLQMLGALPRSYGMKTTLVASQLVQCLLSARNAKV